MPSEKDLFSAALDLEDGAERARFLDSACAGDASLRSRIEKLMRARTQAPGFLESPLPSVDMPTIVMPAPCESIGYFGDYALLGLGAWQERVPGAGPWTPVTLGRTTHRKQPHQHGRQLRSEDRHLDRHLNQRCPVRPHRPHRRPGRHRHDHLGRSRPRPAPATPPSGPATACCSGAGITASS